MKTSSQLLVAGLLALVIVLTSCGGGNSSTPPPPRVVITVTPTTLPYGIVSQPYPGAQLQASGGTAPYTFTSSNLPTGITLSTDGRLAGTTPSVGPITFPILVTVRDAVGNSGLATLNLDTHWPLDIQVSNKEVSSGVPYQGYIVVMMQESNLTATVNIVSGSLPPGLTLGAATPQGPNPSLAITGTPTQSGIFAFTANASDSLSPPRTAQVVLKMYIDMLQLQFYTSNLPNGKKGDVYQYTIPMRGGTPPVNCSLAPGSGPMPSGLTVGAGCVMSGTPTVTGDFSFTIRATDSGSGTQQQTADQLFTMKVLEPLKVTGTLPDGTTGETYLGSVTISGGTPPYVLQRMDSDSCCFVMEKHDLSIHGVPHLAGARTITVGVSDSYTQYISQTFTINVQEETFQQGGEALSRMKVGNFYQEMLTAVSGQRPLTWTFVSGAPPPGIGAFNSNDSFLFSGVASSAGVFPFTLQVSDSASSPKTFSIPMSLQVYDKLPRNESVVDADYTPENNGSLRGSISPYADPVDVANPDQDYYHFRGFAGETYTLNVSHLFGGPLDPVMEIVDTNGQKFATCRNPGDDVPDINNNVDPTPLAFDDVCLNDDMVPGSNIDSQLTFRVPGASGSMVDFYVHVGDFRGDARPDMGYYFYFGKYFSLGMIP